MASIDVFFDDMYSYLLNCNSGEEYKFIWKSKNIELRLKYLENLESNYTTEIITNNMFDLPEIGYDSIVYEILNDITEDIISEELLENWGEKPVVIISIFNYPDEIKDRDNKLIWDSSKLNEIYKGIVKEYKNQKEKMLKKWVNDFNNNIINENTKKYIIYKTEKEEYEQNMRHMFKIKN